MTRKIYRSAQGKVVDMGSLLLQNETVRAVGNMGVNARGDVIDRGGKVIDEKSRRMQRHYQRQTNVSKAPVPTSNAAARRQAEQQVDLDTYNDLPEDNDLVINEEALAAPAQEFSGGLAAAIARTREVKQELEKTPRQLKQQQLKKI